MLPDMGAIVLAYLPANPFFVKGKNLSKCFDIKGFHSG